MTICYATLRHTAMQNNNFRIQFIERSCSLASNAEHLSAIRMMVQELADMLYPEHAEALVESALAREAQEATYVGRGLAVPHARVAGLPGAAVYVASCEKGIAWPQQEADTVVLLAVPDEAPELYLQLLSKTMRWRMKGQNLAELRELLAPTAAPQQ